MPIEADGGVQLVGPLATHDRVKEPDRARGVGRVDVEVGPGEPEHDTDIIGRHENGVYGQAILAVYQGNHQRQRFLAQHHPADDVRGLVAVESGGPHFDGFRILPGRQASDLLAERLGGEPDITLSILEPAGEVQIVQHAVERGGNVPGNRVVPEIGFYIRCIAVVLAVQELGSRIYAHRLVYPASDRVEERPGDFAVGAILGKARVSLLEGGPDLMIVTARTQERGDVALHPTDELGV